MSLTENVLIKHYTYYIKIYINQLKGKENMATSIENTQAQDSKKASDSEYNFNMIRKQAEAERAGRLEAERQLEELRSASKSDDYDEPYVDEKRLNNRLDKFGSNLKQQVEQDADRRIREAIQADRTQQYLSRTPDFYQTISEENIKKLDASDPEFTATLAAMPDNFERQKLVYYTIKKLGLDQPAKKEPSIQETIDAKRRGAFYQPSNIGSAPYSQVADFSEAGRKASYERAQEYKKRLSRNIN